MQKLEGEKRAESLLYVRVHTHTLTQAYIYGWMHTYMCAHMAQ